MNISVNMTTEEFDSFRKWNTLSRDFFKRANELVLAAQNLVGKRDMGYRFTGDPISTFRKRADLLASLYDAMEKSLTPKDKDKEE